MGSGNRSTGTVERAAGVVVVQVIDGLPRFLLLQRRSGSWDLCQGRLESGEDEQSAALRELREETSIDAVDLDEEFRHTISYISHRRSHPQCKRVTFFLGLARSSEVDLSSLEHKSYRWAPAIEAIAQIRSKQKRVLVMLTANWITLRGLTGDNAHAVRRFLKEEETVTPELAETGLRLQEHLRSGLWDVEIDSRAMLDELLRAANAAH